MKNKKIILVTGGFGFIGSHLIKYLIKKKYYIINLDKLSYASNKFNLYKIANNINYKFIRGDINNKNIIKNIFSKYKIIALFNLAAETHVDRSIDNPENFFKSNISGVYNLLEVIRKYKKKHLPKNFKMIHISTDEVYGSVKRNIRSLENDTYMPNSPYAATKASADLLIRSYVKTYSLPLIVANCCNNYGPCQFPEKLIPTIILKIINKQKIPIYGKGQNSREWIYVEDHCEALLKIFLKGKIGESYNVGSRINIKNVDIAKKLIRILKKYSIPIGNKVKIKFVKDRPGHDFRYALDSKKIQKELKWKSKIDLDQGLLNTFEWYLNNMNFFTSVSKKLYNKRLGLN